MIGSQNGKVLARRIARASGHWFLYGGYLSMLSPHG